MAAAEQKVGRVLSNQRRTDFYPVFIAGMCWLSAGAGTKENVIPILWGKPSQYSSNQITFFQNSKLQCCWVFSVQLYTKDYYLERSYHFPLNCRRLIRKGRNWACKPEAEHFGARCIIINALTKVKNRFT